MLLLLLLSPASAADHALLEKVSSGNRFTMETWKLEDEPLDLK
jgi:hypothetical protein